MIKTSVAMIKLVSIFKGIIKTGIQEPGTECWEYRERRTWGMLTRILGNFLEDSAECHHSNVPGNVQEDFGRYLRRSQEMFEKIPGNVPKKFRGMSEKILINVRIDSGECSRRFRGMLSKIPENVHMDYRGCKFRFAC